MAPANETDAQSHPNTFVGPIVAAQLLKGTEGEASLSLGQDLREALGVRAASVAAPTSNLEEWRYSDIEKLELRGDGYRPNSVVSKGGATGVDIPNVVSEMIASSIADADVFEVASLRLGDLHVIDQTVTGSNALDLRFSDSELGGATVVVDVASGVDAQLSVCLAGGDQSIECLSFWINANESSNVEILIAQDVEPSCVSVGSLHASLAAGATLRLGVASLGAKYSRLATEAMLLGDGARLEMTGLYLGQDEQTHDLRTVVLHTGRGTSSELLFRGAVSDSAHSIYTGLIDIGEDASGTVATQENRALVLSDQAEAQSVPNLEIANHDVSCSHASAVGPVDPDQVFYLGTRGVSPAVAESVITSGFITDCLERLPVQQAHAAVAEVVNRRLGEILEGADG